MGWSSFALILTGVLLNAAGQLMLKAGANRVGPVAIDVQAITGVARELAFSLPIIGGITCYVFSVVVWIIALTRVDVSLAYPMLSIGYVVNAVGAWLLFGEEISAMRLMGILVIILGVYLLALSGRGA